MEFLNKFLYVIFIFMLCFIKIFDMCWFLVCKQSIRGVIFDLLWQLIFRFSFNIVLIVYIKLKVILDNKLEQLVDFGNILVRNVIIDIGSFCFLMMCFSILLVMMLYVKLKGDNNKNK